MTRHDLPPRWDDYRVVWDGWEAAPTVSICPPPKPQPCSACGSLTEPIINRGRAWSAPGEKVPYRRPRNYSQAQANEKAEREGVVMANLQAFRCTDCRHDQVIVRGSYHWPAEPELWDLDPSDYGDEGSHITQETLL